MPNRSPEPNRSRKKNRDRLTGFFLEDLRIAWHLLYWTAGFLVLLKIFSGNAGPEKIDILYTTFFLLPLVAATYTNLYVFVPRLLRRERLLMYAATLVLLIVTSAGLIYMLFDRWIDLLLKDYYFVNYDSFGILLLYAFVFLSLSTLLKLSGEWLLFLRRDRENKQVQLKNLRSQVNPHFLLNSLQTIYSMALNKSEQTPDTVLQLSEILKFTLYETEKEQVTLERELEVVKDYVGMYSHRVDPVRAGIRLEISGKPGTLKIAPMLFLPFIENSFKHGLQGNEKEAFVHIHFRIRENFLTFTIENNLGESDVRESREFSGIGIENTKQRLAILYPRNHSLEIDCSGKTFKVTLQIELHS
jgi:sensor histidine kinase YesM